MKNYKNILALSIAIVALQQSAFAQYPRIPKPVQDSADAVQKELYKYSDEAWAKALPIIEADEKKGKPYVPWASKPEDLLRAKIPAFPGAQGGGEYTSGGRGGRVIVVSSLEDRGPGTFREACEQGGARIIVFNVSGIIHLKSPINIRAPYITIEGQSAPGNGICIAGESTLIDTHDVIIRFMRFRRGVTEVTRRDDALGGNPVGNIMIDHVSGSWGLDEVISIYRHVYDRKNDGKGEKLPTVNVTIQNSMFAEGLDTYNHAFGSTIGGRNSTFMRNLWANNVARNPSVGMDGDFALVNNVIFNWWNRSADGGDDKSFFNFFNNYYKPGPITPKDKPISYRILKPESGRAKKDSLFGKAYVNGNIMEGNEAVTKDNWNGGVQIQDLPNAGNFTESIKLDKPFLIVNPFPVLTAKETYNYVLENVGAYLPMRDAVDKRVIEDVKTGKITYSKDAQPYAGDKFLKRRLPADSYKNGIVSQISQVGGYPEYKGTPYQDSDNDGIPDSYESAHGLNPNDATDAPKITKSGYSNIEVYLNSLVDIRKVIPK